MKTVIVKMLALIALALVTTGCVAQKKYDELKFAERNCNAERERLAADLANAQDQNRTIQQALDRTKTSLSSKDQTILSLQQQVGSAKDALSKMTDVYEKLAASRIPSTNIQISLPPELDKALQDFAARYPNMVTYDSTKGLVKFVSDVLFDLGSDVVKPEAKKTLAEFARIITAPSTKGFEVVVAGHTDNIRIAKPQTKAKHPTNWHLSVHRAISVMKILTDNGVSAKKIGVMGYGQYRPVAPNTTAEGRAKNRRVEIFIIPQKVASEKSVKPKMAPQIEK